jgi:hypothetical protein
MMRLLLAAALAAGSARSTDAFDNMNGAYSYTPTPHAPQGQQYSTKWSEYPDGAEYFEVYLGPITTVYSQVWWKQFEAVPLPDDIVERFAGKGMAIMGYETDSVRRKGDKDVDGSILQEDVSVPINVAYNHHVRGSSQRRRHDAESLSRLSRATLSCARARLLRAFAHKLVATADAVATA